MVRAETEVLMAKINKAYGDTAALTASAIAVPGRFTSGSLALDVALGGGWPAGKWVEIVGHESSGKALALDTPLITPYGWTTMGEVKIGDKLFDERGGVCEVTFVTPVQLHRNCFKIIFKDGSSIVTDEDHQWYGFEKSDGGRVRSGVFSTKYMFDTGLKPLSGKFWKFHIPVSEPLNFGTVLSSSYLPINPYVLGIWLGDGKSADGRIYTSDIEIADEIKFLGYDIRKNQTALEYSISDLTTELKLANLLNNKHIPYEYLCSSIENRLSLLQGLMDSDGFSDSRGHCEFISINKKLTEDVKELILGLGHKVHWGEGKATINGRYVSQKYRLTFQSELPVFRLKRKLARQSGKISQFGYVRSVVSVEPVPTVPVRCIQVNSQSHLYLAGSAMIPTHNTAVTLKTIAANQKEDPEFEVLWIAAEDYDADQATALGVDNDRVVVVSTQEMEFAFESMIDGAESKSLDMLVLDSYPALIPNEESEKAMEDFTVSVGARLMNKFARKAGKASKRNADGSERAMLGVIINQYRDKIGSFARYGTPQTSPGGKGKNYFYYARLDVSRDEWIEEKRPGIPDPVKVGQTVKLRTIKNKSAAPQQTASIDFYFRGAPYLGFRRGDYDSGKEYFTMGVLFGVIKKSGAWFSYGDQKWHGKESAIKALREDISLREEISSEVLDSAKNPKLVDSILPENIARAENGTRRGLAILDE